MLLIQFSSGRGPLECSWVIGKLFNVFQKELHNRNIDYSIIQYGEDVKKDTYKSVLISVDLESKDELSDWEGPILWVGKSPYRPTHGRKNWYVQIQFFIEKEKSYTDLNVEIQTFKSSSAGGQHVNKTNSGVRLIHKETGITVVSDQERSQHQNKKVAYMLLRKKIEQIKINSKNKGEQDRWKNSIEITRGNPAKVFTGESFILKN